MTSSRGDALIDATRGLKAYPVARFRDSLFRLDLMGALRKDDPQGRYARAAKALDLARHSDAAADGANLR